MLSHGDTNDEILASDAEREQSIARLRDACGEGRLSLDEFSDRVNAVLAARTRGQLVPITADLPGSALPVPERRNAKRLTFSLMSDVKRKGRWNIDGETTAISVMGSCTLDLRRAVVQGREIIINAYAVMGAVKIIVPRGTPVEMEGFAIMGNRDSKVDDDEALPGSPIVRVRGLVVMGAVDVVSDDPHGLDRMVDHLDRMSERLEARHDRS
jgi:hypothetical protein